MTDEVTPEAAPDPYEDALAARLGQAAAGLDGEGVTRAGVTRAVAARSRRTRRRRTALVGAAAAAALLGGVAVATAGGGGGTNVRTDDRAGVDSQPTPTTTTTTSAGEGEAVPGPVGTLRIEAIGLDTTLLPALAADDHRDGRPRLLPDTAVPGTEGNAVLVGRRAAEDDPFVRLDELAIGDEVEVALETGEVLSFVVDVAPRTFPVGDEALTALLGDLADLAVPRLTILTNAAHEGEDERVAVSALLSHSYRDREATPGG